MRPKPALALGLGLLAACGVKQPPIPPSELLPKPPSKLEARVREGCVSLSWPEPIHPPARYQVLRRTAAESAPAPLAELPAASRDFTDCSVPPGPAAVYQVRSLDAKGKAGLPSPELKIIFPPPPPPPSGLKIEPGDGFAQLCWTNPRPPAAPLGFRVYQAPETGPYANASRNPDPVAGPCWVDGNLSNGTTYRYQVRAVVKTEGGIEVEGPASPEATAVPEDRVAPLPPAELIAVSSAQGVELRWNRNLEPDLKGYYVYRRGPGESRPQRLNAKPLPEPQYLDADPRLRPGREYIYTVTAVDNATRPNESPPGVPASVISLPR